MALSAPLPTTTDAQCIMHNQTPNVAEPVSHDSWHALASQDISFSRVYNPNDWSTFSVFLGSEPDY